jgi:hypothetical protein
MSPKYDLCHSDQKEIDGHRLYRIRALRDFGQIKKGWMGGYIESEDNLCHAGDCWIGATAQVYEAGRVKDNAIVEGAATVCGAARIEGKARLDESAEISGSALICGNARVFGQAKVEGCAYIAGDALIGGDAFINADTYVTGFQIVTHGVLSNKIRQFKAAAIHP